MVTNSSHDFFERSWVRFLNIVLSGGVVKVKIYEVDTKIALYVDTFWLQL